MAANIEYYMKKHNISRNELSNMISVPYTTICTWLQAKSYPRIDKIEAMAQVFMISKADLVEEKKPILYTDNEFFQKVDSLTNENQEKLRDYLDLLINSQNK